MKKAQAVILIVIVLALIVIIGAFLYLKSGQLGQTDSNSQSQTNTPSSINIVKEIPKQDNEKVNTKEIDVIAKQWEFSPDLIRVNQGDKVILNIQSIDVTHGFAIPDFGVSERLNPGETIKVEFTADKKGTFTFFCNIQCGSGHSSMNGRLIVS